MHKGLIDNVNCICEYDGNVSGHFWFSKSSVGHQNGLRIRIYGEKASAEWIQETPEYIRLSHNNGRTEILSRASSVRDAASKSLNRFKPGHPSGFIEALANYYNTIYKNLNKYLRNENYDGYLYGPEISKMGLKFFEATIKSAASKRLMKVN
jgi:predicted dehydrogenase